MLTIIYVYYNSANVIFNSIESLLKNNTTFNFEIIIVINKCTDIDISELELYSPKINVIKNSKNFGFAKACNIGAKYANGGYLLFLNPDTILDENVLQEMYSLMENNSKIGVSNCKLITGNNKIQKNVIYKEYNIVVIISELFFFHKIPLLKSIIKNKFYNKVEFNKEQYPKVISGAFMFFRKCVFDKIKGFDEDFFMYGEDKDISLRTGKEYQIFYTPKVKVYHIGDSSLGVYPSQHKLSMMYSNQLLNVKKNFGSVSQNILKLLYLINAILFYPISFLIKDNIYKSLLKNRSKVFFKLFFNRI